MIPDTVELKNLNKKLDEIGKKLIKSISVIPVGITRELAIGANKIRNTVILSMRNTSKTGRHYRRGKGGRIHIASSPGNPPAIDYGELVRSIMFDVGDMEVEIGSIGGAPYSIFLEEGTEKMDARPFLGPAVDEHEKNIVDSVGDFAFEAIKSGFK
jgi:HK97 gp10 family phage protein